MDEEDRLVDSGTIEGQDGQWIKVKKEERKLPPFKQWLKDAKGVDDIVEFGSTSDGIQLLNRWNAEYEQLKGYAQKLKEVM